MRNAIIFFGIVFSAAGALAWYGHPGAAIAMLLGVSVQFFVLSAYLEAKIDTTRCVIDAMMSTSQEVSISKAHNNLPLNMWLASVMVVLVVVFAFITNDVVAVASFVAGAVLTNVFARIDIGSRP